MSLASVPSTPARGPGHIKAAATVAASAHANEQLRAGGPTDWIEEGRKHFLATKLRPEKLCANYPTQDTHSPKDEADFILGFAAAKGDWDAGKQLSGIEAYVSEADGRVLLRATTEGVV